MKRAIMSILMLLTQVAVNTSGNVLPKIVTGCNGFLLQRSPLYGLGL